MLIVSNGVETDMTAQGLSALRFSDSLDMEFDGATKVKGVKLFTSRKAPPKRAFLFDTASYNKWSLVPMPDESGNLPDDFYVNTDKLQDTNAEVVSLDFPYALVCQNRCHLPYFLTISLIYKH